MSHNLPAGLVAPLKDNPDEGYEQDININADSLAANGFYPQNASSSDAAAGMYRDSSGNLVLKDATNGTKTLSQLASGSGSVSFGTPVTVGTSNSEGVASTAARSDHVHAHGAQTDGTLHAAATAGVAGFMSASDKTKLDSVTSDLIAALGGTSGVPSNVNRYVTDGDSRLTDARTPTAHASSHAAAGSDPLTLSQSQVTDLTTDLAAKVPNTRSVLAGAGLSGGGALSGDVTLSLPDVGTSSIYGSASSVPVITTDSKGRVSAVTNTAISITSSGVSDFSTAVKTVLAASVSAGTGISTSFNAGTGVLTVTNSGVLSVNGSTGAISNVALTTGKLSQFAATTSAELAGVISDETGSGSLVFGTAPTLAQVTLSAGTTTTVPLKFTAGTNLTTAAAGSVEWNGTNLFLTQTTGPTRKTVAYTDSSITGNAATATALSSSRTLALTGDITGSVSSDLSSGASIATTHGSLSGASMHSAATTSANGFMSAADKLKLDAATDINSGGAIVKRDATGNFNAGTITASLSGNATTATSSLNATNAANVGVSNNVILASTVYPTWVEATSGNNVVKLSSTKLSFVPSTGVFSATEFSGSGASLTSIPQSAVTSLTTALSERPTGSGTSGHIAYWSGASTLTGESALYWDITNDRLGIGTTSPSYRIDIASNTDQFPQLLRINDSTHATSRRSAVRFGTGWTMGQDSAGNGTKDFFIYSDLSSAYRMYITTGGNVGFGTTSAPAEKLHVVGNIRNSVLAGTGNRAVYSDANGNLTNSSSDGTLKEEVQPLENVLPVVKEMRPVAFAWKDKERFGPYNEVGFIAQEMLELVPQVIGVNNDDTFTLDYAKLVPVLVAAVKELTTKVEALEAEVAALKAGNPA